MSQKITDLFFDLDHTLWDFDRNAFEALCELHEEYDLLNKYGISQGAYVETYHKINDRYWGMYRADQITKEALRTERFNQTLLDLGVPKDEVPDNMWFRYLSICPLKTHLIPGAMDLIKELFSDYRLHIITNGFKETQAIKMKTSGLGNYFGEVITSEDAGYKKPDPRIFDLAFEKTQALRSRSVYVGDNDEADIQGANRSGVKVIHYNPAGIESKYEPTFSVKKLTEIPAILRGLE
jgi:putative hydrolase of the HAD superfamily